MHNLQIKRVGSKFQLFWNNSPHAEEFETLKMLLDAVSDRVLMPEVKYTIFERQSVKRM